MDPCICLLKDIIGVSKDEYLVTIDPDVYKARKDDKAKVQGALDSSTSNKGKNPLQPITWSGPLLALVWDEPFVVGRVANGIEIRCLEANGINKDTLVQSIPELSKTKHLVRSGRGTIFAAAISELWCIRMVDISVQRQQLLQQKKFQLAIELTVSFKYFLMKSSNFKIFYFSRTYRMNQNWPKLKLFVKFICVMPRNCLP